MVHPHAGRYALILLLPTLFGCAVPPAKLSASAISVEPQGLILQAHEGERRVRRPKAAGVPGLPDPFILKVDRRNGGSQDLVMGYEELAPGQVITVHRHVLSDEIIFVHKGSGLVTLGDREQQVGTGGTVYIPRHMRIGLRNNGAGPLGIAFIFSKPGFEELMRENSVLEGEPVTELSAAEQAAIQERHTWHTVREQ